MWNTEYDIRNMAQKYPNTYSLAVYACCREIHSAKKHTGFIGGTEEEAKAHYTKVLTKENEAQEAKDAAAKEEALKFMIEHQEQKINQMVHEGDE